MALPLAIYLIAVMLPITFNLGPLFLNSVRLVVLVMVVPLAIRLAMGHFGRIIWTDILFALHIAWAAVALAMNNPDKVITQIGSLGPEFLGGYLLGRAYIRTRQDFIQLCRWIMGMVLITLPFSLYESQTSHSPIIGLLERLPGVGSLAQVNIPSRLGLERSQAMTTHPIHYGLFASSAISLTLLGLRGVLDDGTRRLAALGITFTTFLSLSAGALLPMLMQFFLMLWAAVFDRTGRPWLILVLLTLAAYVTIDMLSNRTPIQVFFSYGTFSAHTAYWRSIIFEWGMVNVWANPIYGIGLNDWVRPWYMHSGSMDNFWLVMAVRYGLPGFLFLAAGYALAMWRIGRRDFTGDVELLRLRRAWMFTFVGLTFTLCTVHVWTTVYSFVFMLFGAGVWLLSATPERDPGQPSEQGVEPAFDRNVPPRHHRSGQRDAAGTSGPGDPARGSSPNLEQTASGLAPGAPSRDGPRYSRFPPTHRRS